MTIIIALYLKANYGIMNFSQNFIGGHKRSSYTAHQGYAVMKKGRARTEYNPVIILARQMCTSYRWIGL